MVVISVIRRYAVPEVINMGFCEKLQTLRREKGLSQEMLAESIGISRQAVAKWESGQSTPDIENLIALSDYFRVSIDRLVKEEGDCAPDPKRPAPGIDNDVVTFLLRAKKACYAAHGPEDPSSRPASHDLHFAEGDLLYIDTYLGGEKFAGEEALFQGGAPIWSMNYCGRIVAEGFSGEYLKEVLLLVEQDMPYRGPMVHQNGEYKYHCIAEGSFEWFHGYEEIFRDDKKVYECMFHGGCVK